MTTSSSLPDFASAGFAGTEAGSAAAAGSPRSSSAQRLARILAPLLRRGGRRGLRRRLFDDDLDAAVLAPPVGRRVVADGLGVAPAFGRQPRAVEALHLHEVAAHGLGAALRELLVVLEVRV